MSAITIGIVGAGGPVPDDEVWRYLKCGTPFLFDETSRAAFQDLRARAEANVQSFQAMRKLAADHAAGRMSGAPAYCIAQTVKLRFGWTVTFSIEEHKANVPCRHMSMASPNPKRAPIPAAIKMVLPELGFINPLDQCAGWDEPLLHGGVAVNVLEPVSGNMWDIAREAQGHG